MEKKVFDDPSVALLDEIHDQEFIVAGAGGVGVDSLVTVSLGCTTTSLASQMVGNIGVICTATAECQNNCRH